jgi:hypothetical protein
LIDLGVPLGYMSSIATAITNTGMIVGSSSTMNTSQATAWQRK